MPKSDAGARVEKKVLSPEETAERCRGTGTTIAEIHSEEWPEALSFEIQRVQGYDVFSFNIVPVLDDRPKGARAEKPGPVLHPDVEKARDRDRGEAAEEKAERDPEVMRRYQNAIVQQGCRRPVLWFGEREETPKGALHYRDLPGDAFWMLFKKIVWHSQIRGAFGESALRGFPGLLNPPGHRSRGPKVRGPTPRTRRRKPR